MTSRYCYNPCVWRKSRRNNLADWFRRMQRIRRDKKQEPDLFLISNCNRPVYPGK